MLGAVSVSPAHAQFSSDYQTNIISGVVSNWTANNPLAGYTVGSNTSFDVLLIENAGSLSDSNAFIGALIGREAASSNNSAIVTDSNSAWNCSSQLIVGYYGSGNTLIVSNGATVQTSGCYLGEQIASCNNTVTVTGKGSILQSQYDVVVGDNGSYNHLVISDGGVVVGGASANCSGGARLTANVGGPGDYIGHNSALVTGTGSTWSTSCGLGIGNSGPSNSLIISNGGHVADMNGILGFGFTSNNTVVVTGAGSLWQNEFQLRISGALNCLTIVDAGVASASSVVLGGNSGYGSDFLEIRGGTLDVSSGIINIGLDNCCWNEGELDVVDGTVMSDTILVGPSARSLATLTMSGGVVHAESAFQIGGGGCTATNVVEVAGGTLLVTNASHDAVLEVRNGIFQFSGGSVVVDKLIITNACGHFVHTGGNLTVDTLVLDPSLDADGDGMPNGYEQDHGLDPLDPADASTDSDGDGQSNLSEFLAGTDSMDSDSTFRITSIAQKGADVLVIWQTGIGKTNALQVTTNFPSGFTDIFTATNTVGTATSYLDIGAATNFPARYYRVRLVP
jgi:T5SS/PEP-CTERM-associated repeat protein